MLTEIRIESLGAISAAVGEFDRGLTVLTGETGTGKTMVVTGLHLLGGARADATRVRSGADRAIVEGRFTTTDLDEALVVRLDEMLDASGAERDEDGSVIALRSVNRDGPSRAYLGGRSVPAKSLGDFTAELLTLHGQNDQLRLMRPEEQCGALDRFAKAGPALERYTKLRDAWLSARRDLADRRNRMRELALEADRLTFALGEIDAVDPQPGEDDALVAEIMRLSELDTLREAAATARAALSADDADGSGLCAVDTLGKARAALESTDDPKLLALAGQIGEVLTVVVDAAGELAGFLEELPVDASALEAKLARQSELRGLTRKYAADIDGVLAWARESRQRLAQLDVSEEGLSALAARVDELGRELAGAAADLSTIRRKAAKRLAKEVTAELSGLAMADAQFSIEVSTDVVPAGSDDAAVLTLPSGERVRAGADGIDQVEFGFAAHRGMDRLPLAKSASGGELSRVMLALEVVLAASRKETVGTTMVFDEVDAGVGGRAAVQIGRRLARLARTHQVIVVTHLPQVAAYADVHLVVHGAGPRGTSVVRRVTGDERVAELARMLAGLGESDSGRAHARELLDAAQKDKI
ncbi:DNA repair protein RecN [Mycobacterium avium]|uniref:DNA repair protein RecN n=2 Tax=Mycobacterium avium TaxID=1764 RepID=A0A2A2ZL24_MYCAV|nr:DNA repair protein RecN [Mycobacterium avium]ATO62868.2 DNA repair protein RecN [Mycobacterium avium subsp. hominissuis]ATO67382.1 DNA repair protein RecN [Mycobacterium avium subsp. hominissuis]ATO72459.1 DNA repair protein RecN [Mycobacterium avium subsp. hominissuis]ETZ40757.1 DNA repair protein RecN [Mycobacterium avium MAV_120709_2344]MCA4735903.1 DNA repair protein RecN [Mycobacterium avium subsp. hominissuis]